MGRGARSRDSRARASLRTSESLDSESSSSEPLLQLRASGAGDLEPEAIPANRVLRETRTYRRLGRFAHLIERIPPARWFNVNLSARRPYRRANQCAQCSAGRAQAHPQEPDHTFCSPGLPYVRGESVRQSLLSRKALLAGCCVVFFPCCSPTTGAGGIYPISLHGSALQAILSPGSPRLLSSLFLPSSRWDRAAAPPLRTPGCAPA